MSGASEKMSETAEKLSDLQWKKRERMGVENREKPKKRVKSRIEQKW